MRTTLEPENNLKSIKTTKPKTYSIPSSPFFFSLLFSFLGQGFANRATAV